MQKIAICQYKNELEIKKFLLTNKSLSYYLFLLFI